MRLRCPIRWMCCVCSGHLAPQPWADMCGQTRQPWPKPLALALSIKQTRLSLVIDPLYTPNGSPKSPTVVLSASVVSYCVWWLGLLLLPCYHEFHETCHSVTFYFMKKDSKRCRDTTTPESIHTKDESKRGSAFAFIFGVN